MKELFREPISVQPVVFFFCARVGLWKVAEHEFEGLARQPTDIRFPETCGGVEENRDEDRWPASSDIGLPGFSNDTISKSLDGLPRHALGTSPMKDARDLKADPELPVGEDEVWAFVILCRELKTRAPKKALDEEPLLFLLPLIGRAGQYSSPPDVNR